MLCSRVGTSKFLLWAGLGIGVQQFAHAADWPQWGGNDPGRNMYSAEKGLPERFEPGKFDTTKEEFDKATSENVKWAVKLGSLSLGNVVIAGGKVFIGTNNDVPRDQKHQGDRSILMALDEQTGEFLWQLVIPKLASGKVNDWENLGLVSGATVEGDRIYLATTRCEILCLTTEGLGRGNVGPFTDECQYIAGPGKPAIAAGPKDADIVWRYDMMDELGVFPHNATRSHPIVVGERLYVGTCNGMDWTHNNIPSPLAPSVIALDKHTGKLAGCDEANIGPHIYHSQWGSPSSGKVGKRDLIFYGAGDGVCYAFDANPIMKEPEPVLEMVWKVDCNPTEYLTKSTEKPYFFGLEGAGVSKSFTPTKYPDADGPSEIIATPVFWRDRVYIATGQDPEHGEGLGNLLCIDATKTAKDAHGIILWRSKIPSRSLSTVSITPEGLLFLVDFSGFLHCFDAMTGNSYWSHDLKAHVWGSTLVADGKVYIGNEDGDFRVFRASKEKKLLSEINLKAPIYSTSVAANGVLYVATTTHLFAVGGNK